MKTKDNIKLIPFDEIHKDLMKKPGFKKAYEDLEFEFSIIRAIIKARGKQGLTQRELAERIGIAQSVLARFEAGRANPTLSFLKKVVGGLGLKMAIF
ncbi:MAG: helix-turn-helix transcriptional regulator [Patescibacteria group bacterium]|nr:helix-turn-helix transcriptional regulator [Patescibacteria group bacterium]